MARGVVGRFACYFGEETKLENWQKLCNDLRIEGDLNSITKCRNVSHRPLKIFRPLRLMNCQALKRKFVNIHDLLDAVARNETPRQFGSANELANYTRRHHKFFPLRQAKEGGPVRALLIHIG